MARKTMGRAIASLSKRFHRHVGKPVFSREPGVVDFVGERRVEIAGDGRAHAVVGAVLGRRAAGAQTRRAPDVPGA